MAKLRAKNNLTWCDCQQLLLNSVNEILDLDGRPAPEHKTVSRIYVTRLDCWVVQPEQDRVDADSREACIEHLCFLLRVPCYSMESVLVLNLDLH